MSAAFEIQFHMFHLFWYFPELGRLVACLTQFRRYLKFVFGYRMDGVSNMEPYWKVMIVQS